MQHISRSKSCGVDVMLFYLLMTDNVSYALKVYEDLFKVCHSGFMMKAALLSCIYVVT